MKTVEFKRNWRRDGFTCGCHFECNGADHSGRYVRAEVAERLLDALKRYVGKFGNCGDVYDDAKAAIQQAEEE